MKKEEKRERERIVINEKSNPLFMIVCKLPTLRVFNPRANPSSCFACSNSGSTSVQKEEITVLMNYSFFQCHKLYHLIL